MALLLGNSRTQMYWFDTEGVKKTKCKIRFANARSPGADPEYSSVEA
jgi:hypothetical protein